MTAVLVTRPRDLAEKLAARLIALGYRPFLEPLLSIEPTGEPQPEGTYDGCILTSVSALSPFAPDDPAFDLLRDKPCFCVGAESAAVAQSFGFQKISAGSQDGTALAEIVGQENRRGLRFLHIGGTHLSGTVERILTASGFVVETWATYRAVTATALSEGLKEALIQKKLDSVLFFSPRTARVFRDLVVRDGLAETCGALVAVCFSAAVASSIRSLTWRDLRVAAVPNTETLLSCLEAQ